MTLARTEFRRKAPPTDPKVKTRRCALKGCTERFVQKSMAHRGCCPEHAIQIVQDEKARKLKSERQAGLKALKRRADYLKEAQAELNKWIRLVRDKDQACISCEHADTGQKFDAGHYISRGSRPNLALEEKNLAKQCHWCNVHLSGNQILFRIGLVKRHGTAFVEALEADTTPRKYTIDELVAIKLHYKKLLKEAQP